MREITISGGAVAVKTLPNRPSENHEWNGVAWILYDPAIVLATERANMACTPMQGILALGEANWNTILAYRDTAPWQEKVIIDSAQTWVRNSQNIAFFQYLLGFTDTQVDSLFRAAMLIEA